MQLTKITGTCALLLCLSLGRILPAGPAESIPAARLVEPRDLAAQLAKTKGEKAPLLLHVGFQSLYEQAHIPNSTYVGPANKDEGLMRLATALAKVPKTKAIVLYCGCCPWSRCPNVAAALAKTKALGFKNVKVLHIDQNFGKDWVDLGYPTTR